jgi:hypothetical protein
MSSDSPSPTIRELARLYTVGSGTSLVATRTDAASFWMLYPGCEVLPFRRRLRRPRDANLPPPTATAATSNATACLLLSLLLTLLGLLLQLLPVLLLNATLLLGRRQARHLSPRDLLNSCSHLVHYGRYAKPDTVASPTTLLEERK